MKINTILNMTNYYKLFSSPVKTTDINPITKFNHSAITSQVYQKTFAKELESSFKSYLSSLKNNTDNLNETSQNLLDETNNTDNKTNKTNTNTSNNKPNTFNLKFNNSSLDFTIDENESNDTIKEKLSNIISNTNLDLNVEISEDKVKISSKNSDEYALMDIKNNAVIINNPDKNESLNIAKNYTDEEEKEASKYLTKVEKFVESINNMISFADSNNTNKYSRNIKTDLNKILEEKKSPLEEIGINFQENGTLSISKDKLQSNFYKNNDKVKNLISGENGLSNKIKQKGSEIIKSTYNFSKPASFDKSYKNYLDYMRIINNSTSIENYNKGLLINTQI